MAPSEQPIPLAYLPRLADQASLLSLLFGSASLLLLLGLDVWQSKTKRSRCSPGNSLVLGALTLQLLGLVSHPIVNISDPQTLDRDSIDKLFKLISDNYFVILSGRVVTCVFIGNLLPDIAVSQDRNVWSDIVALAISSTALLIHLSYEIYILLIEIWINRSYAALSYSGILYLVSNIIIFASIPLLVLFLGCAALASKSIQEVVAHRVPVLLSQSDYIKPRSAVWWEKVEEQAMLSWITTRSSQPSYIIARSVLSSSIGLLVTICSVVSLSFSIREWTELKLFVMPQDGFDWLRGIVLAVQWIFILTGWASVCRRWLTAVVFYPRRMGTEALSLKQYFTMEDFWKRAIVEMQEEFMEWDIKSIKSLSFLKRFLFMFVQKLKLYKLLPVFLQVQILLVLMSKTCWLISEMVFSNNYIRRLLMGRVSQDQFLMLYNGLHNNRGLVGPRNTGDFFKNLDVLMHMPGENPAGVWIANLKSLQKMKERLREGESHGKNCKALISLLKKQNMHRSIDPFAIAQNKLQIEKDFNLGRSSAKMMAVSLLTIIIELSAFYEEYSEHPVVPATDTVKACVEACYEAWGLMDLGENLNSEAADMNKQADRLFHSLKESRRWLGMALPINNFKARTVDTAKEALQGLADIGKKMANGGCISSTGYDSKNWKAVIAGNNLYKLCESTKNYSDNIEEMLDGIQSSLADVIGSCLFKVGETIVDECRLWEETFIEEKLWDALYEAGRAKGVTQQLPTAIKFEGHGDKILRWSKSV